MRVTTVVQSISNGAAGRPSRAIFPPWLMFSIISCSARAWPVISRPTSKPSRIPRRRCASRTRMVDTSSTTSAPQSSAMARRSGEMSVMVM